MKNLSELKSIAFSGGNMIINANDYSLTDIKSIAFTAKSHRTTIIIRNADSLSVMDCKSILFTYPGGITFDFT